MKRLILLSLLAVVTVPGLMAQSPVSWSYSAVKTAPGLFEIHITANIEEGWHIYAQVQPEDAIAVPTAIKFTRNPVLKLNGKIKEEGKRQFFNDPSIGISAYQYAKKVDFIQQVKLKTKGKTNLNGSITFQTCTDEKCLPPATIDFSINLNNK